MILERWLDVIEEDKGCRPSIESFGCDNDGEYLPDDQVNSRADYDVEGYGKIEVKFAKPLLRTCFHLKSSQIRSYIKQKAMILMINGWLTDDPVFTLIKLADLKKITEKCKEVEWRGFGGKKSYKVPTRQFKWRPL